MCAFVIGYTSVCYFDDWVQFICKFWFGAQTVTFLTVPFKCQARSKWNTFLSIYGS